MGTKKTYTIVLEKKQDGNHMTRTNDGFNAFELLGILKIAENDVLNQIRNKAENEIDFIKRQVVIDENEKTEKTEE
jgi:hypothetical protein